MNSILSNNLETVDLLDGLREVLLHAAGFYKSGKTKRLNYRNHYCFSDSVEDKEKIERLEYLGLMIFRRCKYIPGVTGTLTGEGVFAALEIASFRTARECCFHCSNLEWVAGEDDSGHCCNGRYYKKRSEESAHLKQLESPTYLYSAKKCYMGIFDVQGMA